MPLDVIKSAANDYSLNIRRYADNSPPPEPHDVRAHLHGGVPKAEVDALAPLFAEHGFNASHLFVPRSSRGNEAQTSDSKMNEPPHVGCYEYLDFAPPLKVRADLRAAIEADPGVKTKEQALLDALAAWWETAVPRLANLPASARAGVYGKNAHAMGFAGVFTQKVSSEPSDCPSPLSFLSVLFV